MRVLGRTMARRAAAVVAVAALGWSASGCGAIEAGSAATVGDTAIGQSDLERRTTDFLDSLAPDRRGQANGQLATVQAAILNEMVLERLVGDAARQAGVNVPDAAVSEQVTQAVASTGDQLADQLAQSYLTRERLPDLLRVNLEVFAIGRIGAPAGTTDQQAAQRAIGYVNDPARNLRVKVNPRYGTWSNLQLTPGNGSLSAVGAGSSADGSGVPGDSGDQQPQPDQPQPEQPQPEQPQPEQSQPAPGNG